MDSDVVKGISPALIIILNVQGQGLEPSTDYENSLFGQRRRILFDANDDGVQYTCSIYTLELIRLYGIITPHVEINPSLLFYIDSTLYVLLHHSLIYEFMRTTMDTSTFQSHTIDDFISSYNRKSVTAQRIHI